MKQHITIKQWQELSLGQQRKFQLVSGKGGLPTIGRMIEFLDENGKTEISSGKEMVVIGLCWPVGSNGPCDGLWKKVKEFLNGQGKIL